MPSVELGCSTEKLGDDVANELVEWFNLVNAKLEQRIAEVMAHVDTSLAQLETRLTKRMFDF